MAPVSIVALGTVLLLSLQSESPAATRLEGSSTQLSDAVPAEQPAVGDARPHLRPRPAPDRFFDLLLTPPGDTQGPPETGHDALSPGLRAAS